MAKKEKIEPGLINLIAFRPIGTYVIIPLCLTNTENRCHFLG